MSDLRYESNGMGNQGKGDGMWPYFLVSAGCAVGLFQSLGGVHVECNWESAFVFSWGSRLRFELRLVLGNISQFSNSLAQ
eukprot:5117130-Amphidinium_carterae.1